MKLSSSVSLLFLASSLVFPAYANESTSQPQPVEIALSADEIVEKIKEKIARLEKRISKLDAIIVESKELREAYKGPAAAEEEEEYRPRAEKAIAMLTKKIDRLERKASRFRAELAKLKALLRTNITP